MQAHHDYFVPHGSYWPITGSVGLASLLAGFASSLHGNSIGLAMIGFGFGILVLMLFGWMGQVVQESEAGHYNQQVDRTFRISMGWFIFSEVMFFAAFFGALLYARQFSVPWLGGAGNNAFTYELLWPNFQATWPLLNMPNTEVYTVPTGVIHAWGLPALNTLLLLLSGVTITWAHWMLKVERRVMLIAAMLFTIGLGVLFLAFQIQEYGEAYNHLNLTMASGIYGSTFFLLTGFHGLHVTLGIIMLCVILARIVRGHFKPNQHFAFEAVAWYWHFVDVVWLGLFIFVYWI